MIKTLNLELSKRLAPYLKNIETKYVYCNVWDVGEFEEEPVLTINVPADFHEWASTMKTLNFHETLTFIKCVLNKDIEKYLQDELRKKVVDKSWIRNWLWIAEVINLEYLEKRLDYILNNNLIKND